MSFIAKRALSTLIPPKIASPANLGSAPNAKRMAKVVDFYKALPRGQAEAYKGPVTPEIKYKQKFFDKDSSKPLIHVIGFFLVFGYSMDYYFHLRHEKHGGH